MLGIGEWCCGRGRPRPTSGNRAGGRGFGGLRGVFATFNDDVRGIRFGAFEGGGVGAAAADARVHLQEIGRERVASMDCGRSSHISPTMSRQSDSVSSRERAAARTKPPMVRYA